MASQIKEGVKFYSFHHPLAPPSNAAGPSKPFSDALMRLVGSRAITSIVATHIRTRDTMRAVFLIPLARVRPRPT